MVLTSALICAIFVVILKEKKPLICCMEREASEIKPKHENQKSFMDILRLQVTSATKKKKKSNLGNSGGLSAAL